MMAPFPAGLMTDAGLLVANLAFADRSVEAKFGNAAYDGTVVWSWQQALLAAGLARQRARTDLPPATHARLATAERQQWQVIDATTELQTSELWSWSFAGSRYRPEPFGARGQDADEANAAQLWSTVFIGLQRPR